MSDEILNRDRAEELFRSHELFRELPASEVGEIVELTESVEIGEGEALFRQGDHAEAMYLIASGELEVRARSTIGQEVVLAVLEPGTVVGEMSLIAGGDRSATVEALGTSRLVRLSRQAFDGLREQGRPVAFKIMLRLARTLGDRRRKADERVREVFEDPAEHVEEFEGQVHDLLGQIRKA